MKIYGFIEKDDTLLICNRKNCLVCKNECLFKDFKKENKIDLTSDILHKILDNSDKEYIILQRDDSINYSDIKMIYDTSKYYNKRLLYKSDNNLECENGSC